MNKERTIGSDSDCTTIRMVCLLVSSKGTLIAKYLTRVDRVSKQYFIGKPFGTRWISYSCLTWREPEQAFQALSVSQTTAMK